MDGQLKKKNEHFKKTEICYEMLIFEFNPFDLRYFEKYVTMLHKLNDSPDCKLL